jgi:lipopolysaccharide export system permease protein
VKRLYLFSLKSFIGPFIVTLLISMFILVMQFFWKYIDDLIGKGLEIHIILELLVYVSAYLIPLALPLAVLLSSIMTMGNLAENNELTALKSSGLSLYRIMRPLLTFMVILSIVTFYFSNYVIPVANLKMRTLIYDIQQTKIALVLKPGAYTKEISGFSIKVKSGKDNTFKYITIYDETNPAQIRVIKADSGEVYKSPKGDYLLFKLYAGFMNEEEPTPEPSYTAEGEPVYSSFRPGRKSHFETATFKLDMSGFQLQRTNEELFKNQFEMMNVFQLTKAVDSTVNHYKKVSQSFAEGMRTDHNVFLAKDYLRQNEIPKDSAYVSAFSHTDTTAIRLDSLNNSQLRVAYIDAVAKLRRRSGNLGPQKDLLRMKREDLFKIDAEFHKKFALSVSVLILFFIGAPLGAIVRKGGFGAPVVIATLLFMIYYVITISGENMAKSEVVSPAVGIWLSSFILTPFAIYLNIQAANDRPLLSLDFSFFTKRFSRKK